MAKLDQLCASDTLVNEETGFEMPAHRLPGLSPKSKDLLNFNKSFARAADREGEEELKAKAHIRPKQYLIRIAVGVFLVGAALAAWRIHNTRRPSLDFSHLPEYFRPAERIKARTGDPPAKGMVWVDNRGWVNANAVPPEGGFTKSWLEANFTHYVVRDAFAFESPEARLPPPGMLKKGDKIVFGDQVGEFSLICTCTRDHRAINMFIPADCLRARADGPPTNSEQ